MSNYQPNSTILKKHKKEKNFTILDNQMIMNKDLSYKALGLLTLMFAVPDTWNFSEKGLAAIKADGVTSVRNGLNELEKLGYLIREKTRTGGKYTGVTYHIFEEPTEVVPPEEKPDVENLSTVEEEEFIPSTGLPYSGNPSSVITPNKELKNKELNESSTKVIKDIVEETPTADSKDEKEPPKEPKPKSIVPEVIKYFNKVTGKNLGVVRSNIKDIQARINEGNYTLEDFKKVIDIKYSQWNNTEMKKYLRPVTLFGTKFEAYLNEELKGQDLRNYNAMETIKPEPANDADFDWETFSKNYDKQKEKENGR